MKPEVLFEDEKLIVLDKPSGVIVYPDGKHDYPALESWLVETYGEWGFYFVHRLDRETSGVMVVAKDEDTYEFLKEQFQERQVRKIYRAFVYGIIKGERGIIDKPIGNARGGKGPRSTQKPHGTLREAITAYRVIERTPEATYVEVFPKTGRTHQIRVHFASIQHPLISDVLYAPSRPAMLGFKRLALHAYSLAFTHPNGAEMTVEAPLPKEFIEAEEKLRKN